MSRSLKSCGHHSLVLRASAGFIMGQDLCVRGHETSQGLSILVVDVADLVAAEETSLFNDWLHGNS